MHRLTQYWPILLVVVAKWTNSLPFTELDQEKIVELPKSLEPIQICGLRIIAGIGYICRTTYAPIGRRQRDWIPQRPIRSIVDDCCRLGCTWSELKRYCANSGGEEEEESRSVSFKTFVKELVEFFQSYPYSGIEPHIPVDPVISISNPRKVIALEDESNEIDDNIRRQRTKNSIQSDEVPQDFDEVIDFSRRIPMISTGYKSSPPLVQGLEKLALSNDAQIAVIIPNHPS